MVTSRVARRLCLRRRERARSRKRLRKGTSCTKYRPRQPR